MCFVVVFVEMTLFTVRTRRVSYCGYQGRIQDFCQEESASRDWWTYIPIWDGGWVVSDIRKDRFATLQNVYCNAVLEWC